MKFSTKGKWEIRPLFVSLVIEVVYDGDSSAAVVIRWWIAECFKHGDSFIAGQ
jgi:hypothetical protein